VGGSAAWVPRAGGEVPARPAADDGGARGDAEAGAEAERRRRREALLHTLELTRRRRQRRLTTRPSLP